MKGNVLAKVLIHLHEVGERYSGRWNRSALIISWRRSVWGVDQHPAILIVYSRYRRALRVWLDENPHAAGGAVDNTIDLNKIDRSPPKMVTIKQLITFTCRRQIMVFEWHKGDHQQFIHHLIIAAAKSRWRGGWRLASSAGRPGPPFPICDEDLHLYSYWWKDGRIRGSEREEGRMMIGFWANNANCRDVQ